MQHASCASIWKWRWLAVWGIQEKHKHAEYIQRRGWHVVQYNELLHCIYILPSMNNPRKSRRLCTFHNACVENISESSLTKWVPMIILLKMLWKGNYFKAVWSIQRQPSGSQCVASVLVLPPLAAEKKASDAPNG